MKRTFTFVAGVLALGALAYAGGQLWAQGNAARPAAAPQTRIALINLPYVIKNYEKYKNFLKDMKEEDKKYVEQIKAKQALADSKTKEAQAATDGATKDRLEQDIRNLKREVEDVATKARRDMQKKGSDMMVKVYKEIRDAAWRHAQGHNYDLVLHFEEASTKEEVDNPALIMRKMNGGGATPLYWNPSLDISGHVLHALNTSYKSAAAPAPK